MTHPNRDDRTPQREATCGGPTPRCEDRRLWFVEGGFVSVAIFVASVDGRVFWISGWFQQKTRENDCVEQDIFWGGTVNSHTLPEGCGFEVNIS